MAIGIHLHRCKEGCIGGAGHPSGEDMEDDRETGAATERERVGRLVRRWRVNALVWIVESRGSDPGVNGRQSGIRWSI